MGGSAEELDPGGSFGMGASRSEWLQRAMESPSLQARGAAILFRDWNATRLVSVGVGAGSLEYIKRAAPDLHMRCGDFAPESLALLKERFVECDWIGLMNWAEASWVEAADEYLRLS
jgi:ubiquinone/menaquinone biosynthesis C-methylase UbiE